MNGITGSLQSPPMILRAKRPVFLLAFAAGCGLLGFVHSGVTAHKLIDGLIPAAPVVFVTGILCIVAGALGTLMPPRLILSPDGLTLETLFYRGTMPWMSINGFALWKFRGRERGFIVQCAAGQPLYLANHWPLKRPELIRLIAQARHYWNG